jgi:heme exporter protein B
MFITTTLNVLHKDLLLEWRARSRLGATLFFALLTLLLFSFASGPDTKMLSRQAAGYLWLGILLSSILSLNESLRIEGENHVLEGLRLSPIDARGLFVGKALCNAILLSVLAFITIPICVAVYGVTFVLPITSLLKVILLGVLGISAPGTLYAAIAVQARARDILLPLLLFPILIPSLLAAVKATSLVFFGDPMQQFASWQGLLIAFNVLYWPLCALLFERVIEE